MANSYVLFDLDTIKVNTRTINNKPTVFCESITIKQRDQDIKSIEDWSNIIIGDPNITRNIGENGTITINISNLVENNGEYSVDVNSGIGLWSVILFKTITDATGKYTTLYNIADESANIGGTGIQGTNIEVIYESDPTYTNNVCVNNFLENVFNNRDDYNGCMFINNDNCGLFLNISPIMFNTQSNLKDIALTNTITYIDSNKSFAAVGVFSDCINLESANIPKYLDNYFEYNDKNNSYTKPKISRVIPTYYFYNCKKLNNISIPDGIHNIEYAAFYGCDKVETINIPASVTSLGSLSLVTVNRLDKRYININGDINNPTNITFYEQSVGYDKLNANSDKPYSANDIIIKINGRREVKLSGSSTYENSSFVKNTSNNSEIYINCETISGTTLITNNQGQQKYGGGFINTNFKTIYIGPRVTSICNFAFYNVIGTNLIIDNGSILADDYGDNSKEDSLEVNKYQDGTYLIKTPFAKSNFNSIHILNCTSIGQYALHSLYTPELKFFELNYNYVLNNNTYKNTTALESLGEYAFYNSQFGRIIISRDVNSISNTTFLQTKGSLELNCNISKYVTDIDESDKKHTGILVNSNFGKITFNYTGSIPENILYKNKSINSIELGEYIKNIYANAFYLCTNLTGTLSLPASIESISETSFIGCTFSGFTSSSNKYQIGNDGMYLLTDNGLSIVLFANKHPNIQITDNTFNIDIKTVNKICGYAFAYAFSDYGKSNVYAVTIPQNITKFGRNVFYNCQKLTRITFYPDNIAKFTDELTSPIDIKVNGVNLTTISVEGSFSDLPLLKDVYIGYATGILLLNSIPTGSVDERNNFLYNTIRNSYTNNVSNISNITIYVYEELVENYTKSAWGLANYKISGIAKDVPPPPPVPPTGNDDSYDADIDDPEGEEWPNDGGNGNISNEEDYIPPVWDGDTTTGSDDSWITHENNVFTIPIKQLGTPAINVYGCRLDLLNPSYLDGHEPLTTPKIIDQFGNIDFSALDYLKFNKVSNETHYGSDNDEMLKLYMGDYGNNFLIVFTVTGIDNFDATTKLFTSGVEYATHRESNWLKTEIVRITKNQESGVYYVVLLCTCLQLQNKDNYNCRTAIVSVNYGSQILDSNINNPEQITTKIKVIQHKTELRLSNDTREINITDLPILFCQQTERTTFTGNFFIGFPKNFWGNGKTITNTQKLREYINDYFRILYDKEKIQIVGQVITINEIEYTYTFDVANEKYANIKATGSTTGVLKKFDSCSTEELNEIHEEYYYVNFKIKNLKTTLAGGVWNISIYNIGEPAEMLNIHVIEDQTDIPSIALYPTYATITGCSWDGKAFNQHEINTDGVCSDIRGNNYVAAECQLPVSITNMPIGKDSTYIFPNIETTDICVDSSAIFTCEDNNMVMSADEITNNFNYALTINIKNNTSGVSSFNMPISSKTLKKQSLSAIKYKKTDLNINPSIYNYDANSNSVVNACLTSTSQITIERIGDKQENDILSNTGAFLYKINTGLSVIADTYTNYLIRTNNTITYNEIDTSTHKTMIKASYVNIENNLCFDHSSTGFIIYDEYCNILAPIYPYFNELNYTIIEDNKTLQINTHVDSTNVYINTDNKTTYYINNNNLDSGPTYYCTATNNILIKADTLTSMPIQGYDNVESNRYIGPAYKVFTNNIATPVNIGVVKDDNNNDKYTDECYGAKSYNGFSKATEVVTLKPIYEVKVNSSQMTVSTQIGNDDLQQASEDYKNHGAIIKVVDKVNIKYNETYGGLCYEDRNKYYNIINDEEINVKPEIEVKNDAWFIYLNRADIVIYTDSSNNKLFTIGNTGRTCYINGVIVDNTPYISEDIDEITGAKFYKLYNYDTDTGGYKYYNINALINNNDNDIYTDFKNLYLTDKIEYIPYITESFNIAYTHINTYDIACNTNVFRQIFVNFSYDINDNNTITKIYADNSNGLILQTRMLNYKPNIVLPTFNTGITLFGLEIMQSSTDVGFTPIINKPRLYIKP